jgi:hypothetical protein
VIRGLALCLPLSVPVGRGGRADGKRPSRIVANAQFRSGMPRRSASRSSILFWRSSRPSHARSAARLLPAPAARAARNFILTFSSVGADVNLIQDLLDSGDPRSRHSQGRGRWRSHRRPDHHPASLATSTAGTGSSLRAHRATRACWPPTITLAPLASWHRLDPTSAG